MVFQPVTPNALASQQLAFRPFIAVNIWAGYRSYASAFLARLQSIPPRALRGSSSRPGWKDFRIFLTLTLPQLWPDNSFPLLFSNAIWTSQQFPLVWLLTGAGGLPPIERFAYQPYIYKTRIFQSVTTSQKLQPPAATSRRPMLLTFQSFGLNVSLRPTVDNRENRRTGTWQADEINIDLLAMTWIRVIDHLGLSTAPWSAPERTSTILFQTLRTQQPNTATAPLLHSAPAFHPGHPTGMKKHPEAVFERSLQTPRACLRNRCSSVSRLFVLRPVRSPHRLTTQLSWSYGAQDLAISPSASLRTG
ncbi:hypothetical protein FQR65_LT20598 [Abscondita terminalis]|nr:hypothetical protein FQR65_LT20598 [Abscondita terminalis]